MNTNQLVCLLSDTFDVTTKQLNHLCFMYYLTNRRPAFRFYTSPDGPTCVFISIPKPLQVRTVREKITPEQKQEILTILEPYTNMSADELEHYIYTQTPYKYIDEHYDYNLPITLQMLAGERCHN